MEPKIDYSTWTVEQLSEKWITEGLAYKSAINKWLDNIYVYEKQNETPCPEEPRKDMGDIVKAIIYQYNKEGKQEELKELFPTDSDPMNWNDNQSSITKIATLDEKKYVLIVHTTDFGNEVYLLENDKLILQNDIIFYGHDESKKWYAKVYANRIDVLEGWDGAIVNSFDYNVKRDESFLQKYPDLQDGLPTLNYQSINIKQIVVFDEGNSLAIASDYAQFIVSKNGVQILDEESLADMVENHRENGKTGPLLVIYDYPHIAVSPDAAYIATRGWNPVHLVYGKKDEQWTLFTQVHPSSQHPNFALFNYKVAHDPTIENGSITDGPQLLLSSCHYRKSSSVGVAISNIVEGAVYDAYEGDKQINYVNDNDWIFSGVPMKDRYFLGDNKGYVWFMYFVGDLKDGYIHVGDTVTCIEFNGQKKELLSATSGGQIVTYKIGGFSDNKLFRGKNNVDDKPDDAFVISNLQAKEIGRYIIYNRELLQW